MTNQCMAPDCNDFGGITYRKTHKQKNRLGKALSWLRTARFIKARTRTRTINTLSSLNDATLKDIGISRGDITWARHLPSATDAAIELEIIARRRTKPQH